MDHQAEAVRVCTHEDGLERQRSDFWGDIILTGGECRTCKSTISTGSMSLHGSPYGQALAAACGISREEWEAVV